jgi:hypothetical protein
MKSKQPHTFSLIRSLFILSGVLLFFSFPAEADSGDFSLSDVNEFDHHFDLREDGGEDSSSEEPVSTASIFDLVLKETPEQEPATGTSFSLYLTKQGDNLPAPEGKEVISGQASHQLYAELKKKVPGSNRLITPPLHGFSFLLSLTGDIAIHAP